MMNILNINYRLLDKKGSAIQSGTNSMFGLMSGELKCPLSPHQLLVALALNVLRSACQQ